MIIIIYIAVTEVSGQLDDNSKVLRPVPRISAFCSQIMVANKFIDLVALL